MKKALRGLLFRREFYSPIFRMRTEVPLEHGYDRSPVCPHPKRTSYSCRIRLRKDYQKLHNCTDIEVQDSVIQAIWGGATTNFAVIAKHDNVQTAEVCELGRSNVRTLQTKTEGLPLLVSTEFEWLTTVMSRNQPVTIFQTVAGECANLSGLRER